MYDLTYMWNLKKPKLKKQNQVHRYREQTGGAKWVKGVKSYKLPVIKEISHMDVMYSMATVVNTVLYI